MITIKELMRIIPANLRERIIILGDRQFGTKRFIYFFTEEGIRFIVRIKKKFLVKVGGKALNSGEFEKGKYVVEIEIHKEGERRETYLSF